MSIDRSKGIYFCDRCGKALTERTRRRGPMEADVRFCNEHGDPYNTWDLCPECYRRGVCFVQSLRFRP